jgi:putative tryptophan/tyrosine transport system substrate-binding protein
MKRREFITGLGGAAAWPLAVQAQQPAMPVVGFLHQNPSAGSEPAVAGIRKGLAETGWVEGRNVAIEYRWAEGRSDRLAELAADLVRRRVAVIVTPGSGAAARAAKAATATIPIVYGGAIDPVGTGLVSSLNRPGGNVTGYTEINVEVASKRLNVLHDLMPGASHFGMLFASDPSVRSDIADAQAAGKANGLQIEPLVAESTERAVEDAFANAKAKHIDAIMFAPNPIYYALRTQIAAIAIRHGIPAIYWDRALVDAGGLISYGSSVDEMFRQVGIYAGRILKGEKPAEMPVMQASKFELVINLKAAKAIGLTVPPLMLSQADEVLE